MMLEVRNLKRIYRTKKGQPVYALKDVSLKFPETGLVFILGKSGSGKSTLLNIMGGLDKADDGEIIINGKSSKEFSGSEMDSYRNTYLGFIFQEYNILPDFSVRENIALALQLQHKKVTDEAIENILNEVDLAGFGKRKPNELSGGQKQRVAIARALVKEPKIIFGDEPTGALDSNTGRQVFETLKKLSKDKLVVIVSHDRDFAEHFGDRVIELKDGDVISDITKTSVESTKASDGVALVGDNVIHVDKDHLLTMEDLNIINDAISKKKSDVFITFDDHVNEAICEAARIDKSGNRQEFVTTDESRISHTDDTFTPIKSKFSLGHAFKMGAKSLRVKPFRLIMTILLSTTSFALFGASATLAMFNTKTAMKNTIKANDISSVSLTMSEKNSSSTISEGFTSDRVQEIQDKIHSKVYVSNNVALNMNCPSSRGSSDNFHMTSLSSCIEIDSGFLKDTGYQLVAGRLPENDKEICISLYDYYTYADLGIGSSYSSSDYFAPGDVTYDKVVGMSLYATNYSAIDSTSTYYTITGIIDTKMPGDLLKYRNEMVDRGDTEYMKLYSLHTSIHASYFIGPSTKKNSEDYYLSSAFNTSMSYSVPQIYVGYLPSHTDNIYFDGNKTGMDSGEGLVSLSLLAQIENQDTSSKEFDYTFAGAYTNADKTDEYHVTVTSTTDLINASYQAAIYKLASDHYEDFYTDHPDTFKAINEGTEGYVTLNVIPPTILDDGSLSYDYTNVTDNSKYDVFYAYCYYYLLQNTDKNNPYSSAYESMKSDYLEQTKEKFNLASSFTMALEEVSMKKEEIRDDYIDRNFNTIYEKYKDTYIFRRLLGDVKEDPITDETKKLLCYSYFYGYDADLGLEETDAINDEVLKAEKEILAKYSFSPVQLSLSMTGKTVCDGNSCSMHDSQYSFNIVGIDLDAGYQIMSIPKVDAEKYRQDVGVYSSGSINLGYVVFNGNDNVIDAFLDFYLERYNTHYNDYEKIEDGYWYMYLNDSELSSVQSTANILSTLTKVFLIVGICLAVFSMLLFYNFMSISINNKKREIGILRAVGAKRNDVFRIFYSESFIIATLNFILATIATFVISFFVNSTMRTNANLSFDLMNPDFLIVLMLLGISYVASIISSILPVTKIANKKPIDAIQNR